MIEKISSEKNDEDDDRKFDIQQKSRGHKFNPNEQTKEIGKEVLHETCFFWFFGFFFLFLLLFVLFKL
eukprot:m.246988 g.246988  ORF g.246988 m.246988 type:complete len:68 (+) comp33852_c0_seq20:50-253(+)